MRIRATVSWMPVVLFALWGMSSFSCTPPPPQPPSGEEVLELLQQEAESLKSEGEDVDPILGVEITWRIEAVELREQTGNEAEPWAGTITFEITSLTPEYDGSTESLVFTKEFDYVFNLGTKRWIMN